MFLRAFRAFLLIFIIALMAQAQQDTNNVLAVTTEATARAVRVSPNPPIIARKDFSLKQTYGDVYKILAAENTCSSFYGGPAVATIVLNQLIVTVQRDKLPEFVSFRMTGRPSDVTNLTTGAHYRIFDKAIVNSEGAFYRRRFDPMQKRPPNVGSFAPATRAARSLILMHELGHLIRGGNGAWLLPDDGRDSWQSKQNTARVERACGAQLNELQ